MKTGDTKFCQKNNLKMTQNADFVTLHSHHRRGRQTDSTLWQ